MSHIAIYIMGVAGSGKTTIGKKLSGKTGYAFYDADDFHPQENINKMKAGLPLTDEDRLPWLDNIHQFVSNHLQSGNIIMACSALKKSYRQRLASGIEDRCRWVFLSGSYDTILKRMQARTDHYMPTELLRSQFDALEVPGQVIEINIDNDPDNITATILAKIC
jgi:carbohydrate kinase (thermoresistant glucokinase family)